MGQFMKLHAIEVYGGSIRCVTCKETLHPNYGGNIEIRILALEHTLEKLLEAFNNHTFKDYK